MDCEKAYIYTLSHPSTGEVKYVGRTIDLSGRLRNHYYDYGTSAKSKWILELRMAGTPPVMEVIEEVAATEQCKWERFYTDLFRTWGFDLLNYKGPSKETKERTAKSVAKMFENTDARHKISLKMKGRTLSESHKAKLSKINTGENNPSFGKPLSTQTKEKISKALKGRVYSSVTIEKMKNALRPPVSDETRARMREAQKYRKGGRWIA